MTYNTHTGNFAHVAGDQFAADRKFTATAGATSVVLQVVTNTVAAASNEQAGLIASEPVTATAPVTPTTPTVVAPSNEPNASADSPTGTVFLPWVSDQSMHVETHTSDAGPTVDETSELSVMAPSGEKSAQEASYRVYLPIAVN